MMNAEVRFWISGLFMSSLLRCVLDPRVREDDELIKLQVSIYVWLPHFCIHHSYF